ncbi:MAG: hypothetical protein RI947_318 [Candidatus Parcubacteria bacterium]|jgi:aspartokinase
MIKISDAVQEIVDHDGFVQEAIHQGILNISAYAKIIHPLVEDKTMKPVLRGTIVVALSRLIKHKSIFTPLLPHIQISNLSVKSSLCEVTYEKTERNQEKLSVLETSIISKEEFFAVTEGSSEITIICPANVRTLLLKHFDIKPKAEYADLVAVTVRFSPEYLELPNAIYTLVNALAVKHINIIEVVSTYTELSFIIFKRDMEQTIQALNGYFQT